MMNALIHELIVLHCLIDDKIIGSGNLCKIFIVSIGFDLLHFSCYRYCM